MLARSRFREQQHRYVALGKLTDHTFYRTHAGAYACHESTANCRRIFGLDEPCLHKSFPHIWTVAEAVWDYFSQAILRYLQESCRIQQIDLPSPRSSICYLFSITCYMSLFFAEAVSADRQPSAFQVQGKNGKSFSHHDFPKIFFWTHPDTLYPRQTIAN